MIDIKSARAATPGTASVVHLNNAGAALMPTPVVRAIQDHIELEARVGGYEAAALREDAVRDTYLALARLLDAPVHQVALTEHATASFVAALSSIPFRSGDVLLTTRHDYISNQIQYLSLADRLGIRVHRAPDSEAGGVDAGAMAEMVHRLRPRVVAMTHVPTNSGLVQDVATVGAACRDRDTWFLVDACQSVGQMPVHPLELGADFLSATARKFLRGPRGAGFLWVSDQVLEQGLTPLFPDLRSADWIDADLAQPLPDARRFESWEFAYALVLGMGAAARYATELGLDAIQARTWKLAAGLRERLARIPGVRVLDRGPRLCGIVTMEKEGVDAADAVRRLRAAGVHTSFLDEQSGLLDFRGRNVRGAVRLSPHYYNTEAELDRAAEAVAGLQA